MKSILHKKEKDGITATDLLKFVDIEPDTDYEYSVERNGVKEDIVIKTALLGWTIDDWNIKLIYQPKSFAVTV